MSTADANLAASLADRVYLLASGKTVATLSGSTMPREELRERCQAHMGKSALSPAA
jgi:ABC-type hemin transport system ATPase subunit